MCARVQSYNSLTSFCRRSDSFWLKDEANNNLFWEVLRLHLGKGSWIWGGNVFEKHEISLSAVFTPSSYLLVSSGKNHLVDHLVQFGRRKGWQLKGVIGPSESSDRFFHNWMGKKKGKRGSKKEFFIYESSPTKFVSSEHFSLGEVNHSDWPRARLWVKNFASEANPPLEASTLVYLARELMNKKNLFLLRNNQGVACAMGALGRSTPHMQVINMIYVEPECRNEGIGREMVTRLVTLAAARGYGKCVLFSDYQKEGNLYEKVGFQKVGLFSERSI